MLGLKYGLFFIIEEIHNSFQYLCFKFSSTDNNSILDFPEAVWLMECLDSFTVHATDAKKVTSHDPLPCIPHYAICL